MQLSACDSASVLQGTAHRAENGRETMTLLSRLSCMLLLGLTLGGCYATVRPGYRYGYYDRPYVESYPAYYRAPSRGYYYAPPRGYARPYHHDEYRHHDYRSYRPRYDDHRHHR